MGERGVGVQRMTTIVKRELRREDGEEGMVHQGMIEEPHSGSIIHEVESTDQVTGACRVPDDSDPLD